VSRYALEALDPELVVWVGWDEPLSTYFLQVQPPGLGGPDELLVWAGTDPGEIASASHLVGLLREWAEVPGGLAGQLEQDRLGCR